MSTEPEQNETEHPLITTADTTNEAVSTASTRERLSVPQQLSLLVVVLFLLLGGTLFSKSAPDKPQPATPIQPDTFRSIDTFPNATENTTTPIDPISASINAEAAFVWDVATQRVLYEKNADTERPLASITKLMTALVAEEIIDSSKAIPISVSAIRQQGESGFYDGERFSLRELIDLTLMTSSNDGAYAIAAVGGALLDEDSGADVFVQAMNIRAEELGLAQTYFRNPTGLDISVDEGGAYGSARDVNFLMEHILQYQPQILERTTETYQQIDNLAGQYHVSENTNQLVDTIPGLIGSKTGYTDLAGGNLVVAFNAGLQRPIIVTVLGSTRSGRFVDVDTLVAAVTETLAVSE